VRTVWEAESLTVAPKEVPITAQSSRVSISRARRARLAAGVCLVAAGVVAAATSTPRVAHAAPDLAAAWTKPGAIPSAVTSAGPAVAVFDGLVYVAWTGKSSPYHLWYSTYNGKTWSAQKEVPSALTGQVEGPALAVFNDKLYLSWLGQSTSAPAVWYSAYNGSTWSAQAKVPSALGLPFTSPALAAYNGDLYASWIGSSSAERVWYSAYNGTTWSAQTKIPGSSSTAAAENFGGPALAVYNGSLFASWNAPFNCTTEPTYCIAAASFNGSSWTSPSYVLGPNPAYNGASGPAMAVDGSTLYDAWYDGYVESLLYTTFNGTSWTAYQSIPNSFSATCDAPGLTTFHSSLFVVWQLGGNEQCAPFAGISYTTGP
jgi:hypothetical protein